MSDKSWSGLPFLDALRPQPGWFVERSILATYSADLVVIVASLLSLAGLDDDRGSGSKVDFANAYETLRGRVRILVQSGRLSLPQRSPAILSIIDRFIREVQADETSESWHPKAALVKIVSEDRKSLEWRLWIGSRNLTRDLSWDTGLTLVGSPSGHGQQIAGVSDMGAELAKIARLPDFTFRQVRQELGDVRWEAPDGVIPKEIRLLNSESDRGLPTPPSELKELIVVSPFLDGKTITSLGRWGDSNTKRTILSTQPELARLAKQSGAPLGKFQQVLSLGMPEPEATSPSAESNMPEPEMVPGGEEIEERGLHAKLIYTEHRGGHTLWLGSSNATQRGWNGPNSEITAKLSIDAKVAEGIVGFAANARIVHLSDLPDPDEEDPIDERLEKARKYISAHWQVTQQRHQRGPRLVASKPPHSSDKEIKLEVGLLACQLQEWPFGSRYLQLPQIPASQETEFVHIRISLKAHQCNWLQRAPLDPPPDEERDRRAIARYLDPRTFLLWIRSLLNCQEMGDGGGDWDSEVNDSNGGAGAPPSQPPYWAPTLEEVLKSWSVNPHNLRVINKKIQHYLKFMQDEESPEYSKKDRQVLLDFYRTWKILRKELVQKES